MNGTRRISPPSVTSFTQNNPAMSQSQSQCAHEVSPARTDPPQRKRPEAPLPPHTVMTQADFLASYRAPLIAAVAESAPPVYQGPASLPSARLGVLLRKPLGAQRMAILAAACGLRGQRPTKDLHTGTIVDPGWRRSRGLGLIFEMGTGKTYCALAALAMADDEVTRHPSPPDRRPEKTRFFPAVVLCPPIMQEKWAREATMTLPSAPAVILRPISTREEATAFRRFDPSFHGKKLSAIGVCDRIARRIQLELAQWRIARDRALAQGKRPPMKPCHTVVISQSTAKFGVPWTPVYVLRVLRETYVEVDPETGQQVIKVRGQREPETGALITVPCCPHCYTPVAEDERHANARERRAKKAKKANKTSNETVSGELAGLAASDRHAEAEVIEGDDDLESMGGLGEDLPYLSEADLLGIGRTRSKHTCTICGSALWQNIPEGAHWQATPPPMEGDMRAVSPLPLPDRRRRIPGLMSTANRRYPIADYLRKRYRGLFRTLIADEAHQYQGAGTAQGYAAASLVDACGPQGTAIALTGTLFSGYSSTLFWMLWRLMPSIRAHFGYDEVTRWVGRYGLRQKTIKVEEPGGGYGRSTGWRSKRKDATPRYRELPGISPLILNLLLPHCLFMDLADVAPNLPAYREEVVTIPLGPDLEQEYQQFQREATDRLKAQLQLGDNSGTSSWFHGLLIWPNLPCQEVVARARRTGVELGRAPALPAHTIYPKERALLEVVRRERAEGRRCLIYIEHTGEHDLLPRLTQLLQDDDVAWRAEDPDDHPGTPLRVMTMRGESVASSQREAWLAKQVEAGCDVLLCHSGLVEVGLDLLAFPTILVYEIIFSTTRWRQAIRRSWRPGQTQEVRVIQLTYEQTMEARGLTLIATKAISSLMVEGKMPSAALNEHAQNSATTNLIMELYEQVVAEAEGADHGDPSAFQSESVAAMERQPAERNAVAEALRNTFLALNRVEQEAEQYIGAMDLTAGEGEAEEIEDAEDGAYGECVQVTETIRPLHVPGPHDAATSDDPERVNGPAQGALDLTQTGQQMTMADLWSATPSEANAIIARSTRAKMGEERTAAQSASPVASGQHHVSWDEMRVRLQREAAARRAKRRQGSSTKPGTPATESGSLWAMSPTPSSTEGSRKPPEPAITSPALPQAGSDARDAPAGDDVGQLSLFG